MPDKKIIFNKMGAKTPLSPGLDARSLAKDMHVADEHAVIDVHRGAADGPGDSSPVPSGSETEKDSAKQALGFTLKGSLTIDEKGHVGIGIGGEKGAAGTSGSSRDSEIQSILEWKNILDNSPQTGSGSTGSGENTSPSDASGTSGSGDESSSSAPSEPGDYPTPGENESPDKEQDTGVPSEPDSAQAYDPEGDYSGRHRVPGVKIPGTGAASYDPEGGRGGGAQSHVPPGFHGPVNPAGKPNPDGPVGPVGPAGVFK